jgi:hypothetical protein
MPTPLLAISSEKDQTTNTMPISIVITLGVQLKTNCFPLPVQTYTECFTNTFDSKTRSQHRVEYMYEMHTSVLTLTFAGVIFLLHSLYLRRHELRSHDSRGDTPICACASASATLALTTSTTNSSTKVCCERL